MNILIISPYLPYPLSSGGAQAVFNMIDNLRHQHSFTMVINEGGQNNEDNRKVLQQIWPDVDIVYYPFINQLLSPSFVYEKSRRVILRWLIPNSRFFRIESTLRPYGEWFSCHHVSFVHSLIKRKHIDLVQVEFAECLFWVNHLPSSVKKIFVHHELGFIRKERLLANYSLNKDEQQMYNRAKSEELSALEKYDAVITVTEIDKKILIREGLSCPIFVSYLAVNTQSSPYSEKCGELVFVGGYGHFPNKEGLDWFLTKVVPLLKHKKLKLNLIGTHWPSSYANNNEIEVLPWGFVENLSDVSLGNIMIVPILSGSGMRMKILEAAAMSLPIVTTSVGVEGLDFRNGESCIIEDTPEEWANAIIKLLTDSQMRRKIGENANKVYREKYSPTTLASVRNSIYEQICK